jgi:hypothetical protein
MSATRPAKRPLPLLEQDIDPRDDLFDVDRLGQVVVDTELEAANLVLDRGLGGEEHERDLGPVGGAAHTTTELEAIEVGWKFRFGNDQVGCVELELVERVGYRYRRRDGKSRFAKRDLQHSQTASVAIDQEQALLGHESPAARQRPPAEQIVTNYTCRRHPA